MNPTETLIFDLVHAQVLDGSVRRLGVYDNYEINGKAYLVTGSMATATWTWVDLQGNVRTRREHATAGCFRALAKSGRNLLAGQAHGPSMKSWLTGDVIEFRDIGEDFYFTAEALS